MYSKYPRIDKSLIEKYHEGLIATTCCIGAHVPQAILKSEEAAAEKNLNGGWIFLARIIILKFKDIKFRNNK